jgi:hypothetical protein
MELKTVTIEGKYTFGEREKANLSLELANKTNLKAEVEGQKKARMSDFKQQVDQISSDIRTLSVNLVRGYEFRNYRCSVEKNFKTKMKTYRDITNGAIIDERPLSQADYQIEMDDIKRDGERRTPDQDKAEVKEKRAKQKDLEKQADKIIKDNVKGPKKQ